MWKMFVEFVSFVVEMVYLMMDPTTYREEEV